MVKSQHTHSNMILKSLYGDTVMILRRFQLLPLAIVLLVGCKTSQPAADSDTRGLFSCKKPKVVEFRADPGSSASASSATPSTSSKLPSLGGSKVELGFFDFLHVEVAPDDFKKLDSHTCNTDGTCTAVLTKPVKVNVNVPVSLMSKIAITYEQGKGEESDISLHKVSVGTKITPINLGRIMHLSIDMGASVSKKEDMGDEKVTYDAKPYCRANFSCSLPFLSVGAHMDQKGVTFDSSVAAQGGIPNALIKVSGSPVKSVSVPFTRLPESIKKLKEYFTPTEKSLNMTGDADSEALSTDLYWDDFADMCEM